MEEFLNAELSILTTQEIAELKTCVPKLAEAIQNAANQQIRWNEKLQAEDSAPQCSGPLCPEYFQL